VATTVLLLDAAGGEFCLRQTFLAKLARLGVTSVVLVGDERTVGLVLEGWMFDPTQSAEAAADAVGVGPQLRTLHPVVHMAVPAWSAAPSATERSEKV
jgi:hypothetical protein